MLSKSQAIFASFLMIFVFWSSTSSIVQAQNEELRRPTRPDVFNSPEEVAQYVRDLHEYVRAKGIRYGKRFAPLSSDDVGDENLHTAEMINELNKHQQEEGDNGGLSNADAMDEENPQEQLAHQQMRPMKATRLYRLLTQIPLPLLTKYLHMNQMMNQSGEQNAAGTRNQQTMLHPFVRQRFLATKQKFIEF